MVSVLKPKLFILLALALVANAMTFCPVVYAAEGEQAGQAGTSTVGDGIRIAGLGLGAALAISMAGLATGRAQAAVGAGGTGALAEKPELFTNVIILFAIPETIVILGFVVAFLLYSKI